MAFGRLMHTIFELAAKGDVRDDPEDLKAAYRKRFNPGWFPTRAIAYQYWRDGMGMLELWHRARPRSPAAPCGSRSGSRWRSGTTWSGAASTGSTPAPEDIILLDYKTARYPASEEEAERSLQLAIYYLAALRDPELAASAARSRCSSSTRPGS